MFHHQNDMFHDAGMFVKTKSSARDLRVHGDWRLRLVCVFIRLFHDVFHDMFTRGGLEGIGTTL